MKVRYVIMAVILLIVISMFISNKDMEQLVCTTKGEMYESPSSSTIKINIQKDMIKDMNMTMDIYLKEELMKERDELVRMIEAQGKSEVKVTSDGIRLASGMNSEYFTSLGLSKNSSYKELKSVLELQGFTCK